MEWVGYANVPGQLTFEGKTLSRSEKSLVGECSAAPFLQQGIPANRERFSLYSRKIAVQASSHLPDGYQLPDLQKHLDIVCDLAMQQIGDLSCLTDESVYSMASALYTAGINTPQDAKRLGLVIVPPGPVVHTWYALHGTTLPNGKNSHKGYDYVSLIEKEAEHLRTFRQPVLFMYSILKMTDEQVQEMSELFKDNDNIIPICLETDFAEHDMVAELAAMKDCVSQRCDAIRFLSLKYKDDVLSMAVKKAKARGKERMANSLDQSKGQTLVYSDIDNVIIRPDLYMLTSPGIIACNNPLSCLFFNDWFVEKMNPIDQEKAKKHNSYLQHVEDHYTNFLENPITAQEKNDKLHDALFSTYLIDSAKKLGNWCNSQIWHTECGHYRLGRANAASLQLKELLVGHDFRQNVEALNLCRKEDRSRLTQLAGMQQLRYMHVNYHTSWEQPAQS